MFYEDENNTAWSQASKDNSRAWSAVGFFFARKLAKGVDDHMIMDDETFDQKAFLAMVKASPNCPKTACPSPEAFKKACECDAEDIYIITLSSHLSLSLIHI